MLLVDYRAGSKELVAPLRRMGVEVDECTLDFGDIAFTGRGDHGKPTSVGVEYKHFSECVASLRTERLQGFQSPGMRDTYDFSWLLVEGEILHDKQGRLQRRVGRRDRKLMGGGMTLSEYHKRLIGLHLRGGLNPWHTQTQQESVLWLIDLYRTWTDLDFDAHTSHLAIYQAPMPVPVSKFRQAVCAWPTIGFRTSKAVEKAFQGSLRKAANAPLATWANIAITDTKGKSRRLGEKDAAHITTFLEGK